MAHVQRIPVSSHEFPNAARRPRFSVLDPFGFPELLGYDLPDWKDATSRFLAGEQPVTEHILVTGCAGFIGSNFIYYYLEEHPDRTLIGLDKLTYAGNLDNLSKIPGHQKDRFHFIRGDVCDAEIVERAFRDFDIDGVIHFAAESHVDRSIIDPQVFLKSNILGTFVLLDAARKIVASWEG